MCKKIGGVRVFWDGENFWTINWEKIYIPTIFKEKMPKISLDGELWY